MKRSPIISDLFTGADVGRGVTLKGNDDIPNQNRAPDTGVLRISTPELTKLLSKLKSHSSSRIKDLPNDIRDELKGFAEMAGVVSETSYYTDIVKIVTNTFGDVKVVLPDTVGAFFRGCFVSDEFPGLQACSPICAGMMPPTHDVNGWTFCQENVLYFDGDKLSFMHMTDQRKDKAIIHIINPSKYNGFTQEHIQALIERGIKFVSLFIFQDSGKSIEKLNSQPVTSLPKFPLSVDNKVANTKPHPHPHPHPHPNPKPDPKHNDDNGWLWILLVFFAIVIIGGLVWWSSRQSRQLSASNGYSSYGQSTLANGRI